MPIDLRLLRGITAPSARRVMRLCRVARRLETLANEGYRDFFYCNTRSALWELAERTWAAIVLRDDGLRGAQTIALAERIVSDGCAVVYQGRIPGHFVSHLACGDVPLKVGRSDGAGEGRGMDPRRRSEGGDPRSSLIESDRNGAADITPRHCLRRSEVTRACKDGAEPRGMGRKVGGGVSPSAERSRAMRDARPYFSRCDGCDEFCAVEPAGLAKLCEGCRDDQETLESTYGPEDDGYDDLPPDYHCTDLD